MAALHLNQYLRPLWGVRTYAHRTMPQRQGRELRLLQRCVAAARLGVNGPRDTVRPSLYEDLR
jgi:hypothetical protein